MHSPIPIHQAIHLLSTRRHGAIRPALRPGDFWLTGRSTRSFCKTEAAGRSTWQPRSFSVGIHYHSTSISKWTADTARSPPRHNGNPATKFQQRVGHPSTTTSDLQSFLRTQSNVKILSHPLIVCRLFFAVEPVCFPTALASFISNLTFLDKSFELCHNEYGGLTKRLANVLPRSHDHNASGRVRMKWPWTSKPSTGKPSTGSAVNRKCRERRVPRSPKCHVPPSALDTMARWHCKNNGTAKIMALQK